MFLFRTGEAESLATTSWQKPSNRFLQQRVSPTNRDNRSRGYTILDIALRSERSRPALILGIELLAICWRSARIWAMHEWKVPIGTLKAHQSSWWTSLMYVNRLCKESQYDTDCTPYHRFFARTIAITAWSECTYLRELCLYISTALRVCQHTVQGDAIQAESRTDRCAIW